jgi:ribose transport system permease protein
VTVYRVHSSRRLTVPPADSKTSQVAPLEAVEPASSTGRFTRVRRLSRQTVTWVALLDIILLVVFEIVAPGHVFLQVTDLQDMALDGADLVLLAGGTALLLGAGEFDISLGANLILSSVVGARTLLALSGGTAATASGHFKQLPLAICIAVGASILTGLCIGIINGLVVSRLHVNALVATLGMLGAATGLADLIAGGADIGALPQSMQQNFGIANVAGIPAPALVVAVIVLVLWHVLHRTRFGMRTIAIGSSRDAAVRAGIKVWRHQVRLYAIAGALAGTAGFLDLVRFDTTNIGGHQTDALAAIAAAVIGGASLRGGRASVGGAVIGVALAIILQTGLIIAGLSAFYQLIAIGVVLVLAVAIDEARRGPTRARI